MPSIIQKPSRHYSSRRGKAIKSIVLHHTAGSNSLGYLMRNRRQVSSHYLISKEGSIYQLVDEKFAAHHVGSSAMGKGNPNRISIGIEIENLGNGHDPYTELQLQAVADLCKDILKRMPGLTIVPHKLIDTKGKIDPSLDWEDMMKRIYVSTKRVKKSSLIDDLKSLLKKYE